jgi:hypothetical protein
MMDDDAKLSNNVWKNPGIAEAVKERRRLGEETKQRVLSLILESEPQGMTTNELVKATGRNRRTIHGICRGYMKKGLMEKSGRYGKYHLSSNAMHIDDPAIGSDILQYQMIRTQLFALGEVAFSSAMDFFDAESFQQILNNKNNIEQKESLEKVYLFEFALRWGALILYILIQSMKYAQPSLNISESLRNHLVSKRLGTIVNPHILGVTFEQLLLILEGKIWKEQELEQKEDWIPLPPEDEGIEDINEKIMEEREQRFKEMESIKKRLMEQRFKEMESIYKKTFPSVFEQIGEYDMVYEPGILAAERDEQEDPNHSKCGGELMHGIYIDPDGRRVKKCLRCKRLIPVEDSKP